jgi:hypothetical protein
MIETAEGAQTYWDEIACFYWMTGAPLRPAREDIRHLQHLVERHAPRPPAGLLHALMLNAWEAL